ncbi:MAG: hypothetical protein ACSHWP_00125 [Pseudoalteromonas sp.]
MTSIDEFKKMLEEANEAADIPADKYHDIARKIVNIERKAYYGEDSSAKRLSKIRELISMAAKEGNSDEV